MPNHEYFDRFKDLVAVAERLGAKVGMPQSQVTEELQAITTDSLQPTEEERDQAETTMQDHYLAVIFLLNSDKHRYGSLIRDVKNDFTRGMQMYPTTLNAAYDYIVNYRLGKEERKGKSDGVLEFYNEEDCDGAGRGHGSGRGGGRGQGNGGQGQGHGQGHGSPQVVTCV
jgi:hypothetical protein